MNGDDISKLVEVADSLVYEKTGQHLEPVEKDILRQTLAGKKLCAIVFPSYENSYVQRFRAPKLWERLSVVTGERVRKKTVQEVLERLQKQQRDVLHQGATQAPAVPESQFLTNVKFSLNGFASSSLTQVATTAKGTDEPNSAATDHHENQKVTAQEFRSQSSNFNETGSGTSGSPIFRFAKPGIPLLLTIGVFGCLFALSWLANWYGVKNHIAGQLPNVHSYSWALKFNPLSTAAHYNQAVAYEDQQNYERAHAKYQLAIEGGLIEAYNNQARLYILEGNYDAAVSLLKIALPLAKDHSVRANMYKNRGWARLEQGRYDEAKLDLAEAIKLDSDRAPAYCLLAQVVESQGDKKGALLEWENCLSFAYQSHSPEEDKWFYLAQQRLNGE